MAATIIPVFAIPRVQVFHMCVLRRSRARIVSEIRAKAVGARPGLGSLTTQELFTKVLNEAHLPEERGRLSLWWLCPYISHTLLFLIKVPKGRAPLLSVLSFPTPETESHSPRGPRSSCFQALVNSLTVGKQQRLMMSLKKGHGPNPPEKVAAVHRPPVCSQIC